MRVVKSVVQSPEAPDAGPTLRTADDLARGGLIDARSIADVDAAAALQPLALTAELAALIDPADEDDPIARQFVPDARELAPDAAALADPIGDDAHSPLPGIVHRHADRVLLKPVMTCPVYCRFCFRREAVGVAGAALSPEALDAALDYIRSHDEIWEVILTGGDPLMLSPRRLGELIAALDAVAHVAVIRIHSRVPVAQPARVTAALAAALRSDTAVWVVLHCNHAREITPAARRAIATLVDAGVPMLSQTVLLKGVNDDEDVMAELMRALVRCRVKPYYLHHADLARGAGHFRTTIARGREIVGALRAAISGLCQPTYVLDIPGGFGKVPAAAPAVEDDGADGRWRVTDHAGRRHVYRD